MQMLDQTRTSSTPPTPESVAGMGTPADARTSPDDVARLRAELDRLLAQQRELMELLGTKRPDKILHDVRNLLQERIFLEAACRQSEP